MESTEAMDARICKEVEFQSSIYDDNTIQRLDQNRLTCQDNFSQEKDDVSQKLKGLLCITDSSLSCEDSDTNESEDISQDSKNTSLNCPEDDKNSPSKHNVKEENIFEVPVHSNVVSDSSNSFTSIHSAESNGEGKDNLHGKELSEFSPPNEKLTVRIMKQAEEVFSDFNILKDNFLQKHIRRSKEGYISIKFVASFRKIKSLTKDWRAVKYSIQGSEKLMLNEKGTKVRRIEPIPHFEETPYAKTVVAFNLPCEIVDDICKILSPFGEIRKITLISQDCKPPEICTSRFLIYFKRFVNNKSFAVIEFMNYSSAVSAVTALQNIQNCEDTIKVVPLISDEYRNQSKPSSRRKGSSGRSKTSTGKSSYERKSYRSRRSNKSSYRKGKYSTSEAENNTDSSTGSIDKSRKRYENIEETEFVPPNDELAQKIMKQAENWFSDFSLFKTNFLINHIRRSKEGYISVKLVASSRKIRVLTKDWRVVQYSIRLSDKLALNDRGTKVRRIDPINKFEDTIYAKTTAVFNIPFDDITCDNVCQLMSTYGNISHVTVLGPKTEIPEICTKRFLTIHDNFIKDKYFALVQYESYDSAIEAISKNESNTTDNIKVVPIMSDAYKVQSNPSSLKRSSKSSKTNSSSNDSKQNRRKIRNGNKYKFSRQRKSSSENEHLRKIPDDRKNFRMVKRASNNKQTSTSSSSSRANKQGLKRNYRSSVQKSSTREKDIIYDHPYDSNFQGEEIASAFRGNSPSQRRVGSSKIRGQNTSPRVKYFRFPSSSYTNSYASNTNVMSSYWDNNNLPPMRDTRMFVDNQCSEPPPYPGSNILNLVGHGIPWPPYQDSYRDPRRRNQNNAYWLTPAQLLTREYVRWQDEFRKSTHFSLLSSQM